MKNAEGLPLTVELDRRLKLGVERLRDARKDIEELTRLADSLGPLLGVRTAKGRGRANSATRPAQPARGQPTAARTEPTPPPARGASTSPGSSAPAAAAEQDEVPEWRKLFPALSANVPPGRSK